MDIKEFLDVLNVDFFTGVPDSQLKALCDYLIATYGVNNKHHVIAANEGNAVGIAAGYHLGTGNVPLVYMQNSGEGNAINPIASLLNEHVYAIPTIFVIGWRGEPGVHDEPQHVFQGMITCSLLEVLEIPYFIISSDTTIEEIKEVMNNNFLPLLKQGKQVAFVVRKNTLTTDKKVSYKNDNTLTREEAIKTIVKFSKDDPIISTTGKASRELYEAREANGQDHSRDFLTVGSMGHASSIALGLALQHPEKRIWIIDGDGALLMHMGALPVIESCNVKNLVHVVINNGAHESVGGQPSALKQVKSKYNFSDEYNSFYCSNLDELKDALSQIEDNKPTYIEVACAIGSRYDLGRPVLLDKNIFRS